MCKIGLSCIFCSGLFTYNSESGYYWFNTELAADRENEYSLVGLVSSPTNIH